MLDKINKVLETLYKLHQSADEGRFGARGTMANLRNILVDTKKHRAWPALCRVGIYPDDPVAAFIAGCFAIHPCVPTKKDDNNFGVTCSDIQSKRGENNSDKTTPIERRFQHVLSAEPSEVQSRVLQLVKLAKASDVVVNYRQLWIDLTYWTDRTKMEWAAAFWTPGVSPDREGAE